MPYHHGDLRRALLDAALEEIDTVGAANLSLREIARRAGVSHAAPAHHFTDKAGVFTAIAAEGFTLLSAETSRAAAGPDALLGIALAYIGFAIGHRAHYGVMWQPELLRDGDPDLVAAKAKAFEVFYRTVAGSVGDTAGDEFIGSVVAAWSLVHGFATLWLSGNFPPEFGDDALSVVLLAARGVVAVGDVTARQLGTVDR